MQSDYISCRGKIYRYNLLHSSGIQKDSESAAKHIGILNGNLYGCHSP